MQREVLRGKIHRVTVTQAELDYEGSLTVDAVLLGAAGLAPHEKVEIYNITNGHRFATYLIEGERNSGTICVNGAAAHLASVGDLIIITGYGFLTEDDLPNHRPRVVLVDKENRIRELLHESTGAPVS